MTATTEPCISMAERQPLVSAVIPTRNRPDLVCRAVRSALAQTYPNLEVVVVIDGPDDATVRVLEALNDARIRIVALQENVGGSEARNVGVRAARGEYIGLLDDDDEWLPEKISKQVRKFSGTKSSNLMVATKYINRDEICDAVLPAIVPEDDENLSEFLFCRCSVFGTRLGFIQTSTWMVPKKLLLDVPFTPGLKVNQDTDWILRAAKIPGFVVAFVDEALAVFYNEPKRARIGSSAAKGKIDWTYSFDWAVQNRMLFTTPKAFAFFIVTVPCSHALSQGALRPALLRAARLLWPRGHITFRLLLIATKYILVSLLPANRTRQAIGRAAYTIAMRRFSAR